MALICEECGRKADVEAAGWRIYRVEDTEDPDAPPFICVYCPECAEREFDSDVIDPWDD